MPTTVNIFGDVFDDAGTDVFGSVFITTSNDQGELRMNIRVFPAVRANIRVQPALRANTRVFPATRANVRS